MRMQHTASHVICDVIVGGACINSAVTLVLHRTVVSVHCTGVQRFHIKYGITRILPEIRDYFSSYRDIICTAFLRETK